MSRMYCSIMRGDVEDVQLAVEEDPANVDGAVAAGGVTPLLLAVEASRVDVAHCLLERGASVDLCNDAGWTPLLSACRYGKADVVEMLLGYGAGSETQDRTGLSPLMSACRYGQADVVAILISHGAQVDLATTSGCTALMYACRHGQLEIAEALIAAGAALDAQNEAGFTALMFASREGRQGVVELLRARGADLDLAMNKGWTALMLAASRGQVGVVETLVAGGANLDVQSQAGWTALMYACQKRAQSKKTAVTPVDPDDPHLRCAKLIWAAGADPHLRQHSGRDARAIAKSNGHDNVEAFLTLVTVSRVGRLLLEALRVPRKEIIGLCETACLPAGGFDEHTIGDAGAQALAEALMHSKAPLCTLNLSSSGIGQAGVQALARALEKSSKITEINLCGNEMSTAGAQALARAVEKRSAPLKICLDDGAISDVALERIERRRLQALVGHHDASAQKFDAGAQQKTPRALLTAKTDKARAARVKALTFVDEVLQESLSILAGLADLHAALGSFDVRTQAIEKLLTEFEALQKTVVRNAKLAQPRNEKRIDLVERMKSVLSDGLEARLTDLVALRDSGEALNACKRAWEELFCTPPKLVECGCGLAEVVAAGSALIAALAAWKARHENPRARTRVRAPLEALRLPQTQALMATEERTLREELAASQSSNPMADVPLDEIRTALALLGSIAAVVAPAEARDWATKVDFIHTKLSYLTQGLTAPDVAPLMASLRKARSARRDHEKCRANLEYARGELHSGSPGAAKEVADLEATLASTHNLQELESAVCRERAGVLRFTEIHYPELLRDDAWCRRIGIAHGALGGAETQGFWLDNVSARDFAVVQTLADQAGVKTERVRDRAGHDFVLKTFYLASPANHDRFHRQVQTLAKAASAYVVGIEGLFMDGPHLGCILTPYYPGGDLGAWIRNNPFASVETRKRIATGILTGVHDLHQRGLVHGDLRPERILLTQDLLPALCEFGGLAQRDETTTGSTRKYLAPELRASGAQRAGPRADLYSVGVILGDLFRAAAPEDLLLARLVESLTKTRPEMRPSALEALHAGGLCPESVRVAACAICLEDYAATAGASCAAGHFACSACLGESVRAAAQLEAYVSISREAGLTCVAKGCAEVISGKTLAARVPGDEEFATLLEIVRRHYERDSAQEQEREVCRRVQAALREHGLDTETQGHLKTIVNEILVLSCPRCSTAFADFDGCCALKCGSCPCYFCAWCLKDTGNRNNACHRHVAFCSARPDGEEDSYFSSMPVVQQVWAKMRERRLRAYFAEKISAPSVRAMVCDKLVPLLTPDIVGGAAPPPR